ncbi:hypothetical protein F4782DRAFT_484649, partial [Xylaria castorea]
MQCTWAGSEFFSAVVILNTILLFPLEIHPNVPIRVMEKKRPEVGLLSATQIFVFLLPEMSVACNKFPPHLSHHVALHKLILSNSKRQVLRCLLLPTLTPQVNQCI